MTGGGFDLVELAPLPAAPRVSAAPLREMAAFRQDAWTPAEDDELRRRFRADEPMEAIAGALGRGFDAVRSRAWELGLRRRSALPWTEGQDAELLRRYGTDPTAEIAADLGRSCASIRARAAILGLTEGNAPAWTAWEDEQMREGYRRGVAVRDIAVMIGRSVSAMRTRASNLGLRHAAHPPGWAPEEAALALDLAEAGERYARIAERLAEAGFPRRGGRPVGAYLRTQGYERGWGRPWTPEEDEVLREAYRRGDKLVPVLARLGRTAGSIRWRAGHIGLQGTHPRPNGFRQGPVWTPEQDAVLRAEYGRTPTRELARRLGRGHLAVCQRAAVLGVESPLYRPWSEAENRAVLIAWKRGLSITDLARALGRDVAATGRKATKLGIPFSARATSAPRTPRAKRAAPTLEQILALGEGDPDCAEAPKARLPGRPRADRPAQGGSA